MRDRGWNPSQEHPGVPKQSPIQVQHGPEIVVYDNDVSALAKQHHYLKQDTFSGHHLFFGKHLLLYRSKSHKDNIMQNQFSLKTNT